MAKITIYHNPQCGTSRNTLGLIRNTGVEPEIIEYLKTPPSREKLVQLIASMGIGVRDLLRRKGTPYDELGLDDPALTDEQLLDAMLAHPILMNRPIVETPLGTKLCRPSELVLEILPRDARFPQLTLEELDARQRPLGDQVMKVSSVGLGGPYNPLLRSPVLGQRVFDLLHYLRWETSVPLHLNEFAILIVARQWRSQVEWFAHAPIAIKAGLSPDIVAQLKQNERPGSMKPEEAAVYDFVTELTQEHVVSDATFERTKRLLGGEQQIVDLTAVAGTYISLAMLLAMAEQGIPPGKEAPFKPGDP